MWVCCGVAQNLLKTWRCHVVTLSWQAWYFLCVLEVSKFIFHGSAVNREVATSGGSECHWQWDWWLVCQRVWCWWARTAKLFGRAAWYVCSDETSRCNFDGSLVRNARLATLTCDFRRQSRTKCLLWRLWWVNFGRRAFGGSLIRSARFGKLKFDYYWRKSRTRR